MIEQLKLQGIIDHEKFILPPVTHPSMKDWMNVGGQLIPRNEIESVIEKIKNGQINSWDSLHDFYQSQSLLYPIQKLQHAITCYESVFETDIRKFDKNEFKALLLSAIATKEWMVEGIYNSRAKDYTNPFRKMVYDTTEEMNAVIGKLEENSFIKQQQDNLIIYKNEVNRIIENI